MAWRTRTGCAASGSGERLIRHQHPDRPPERGGAGDARVEAKRGPGDQRDYLDRGADRGGDAGGGGGLAGLSDEFCLPAGDARRGRASGGKPATEKDQAAGRDHSGDGRDGGATAGDTEREGFSDGDGWSAGAVQDLEIAAEGEIGVSWRRAVRAWRECPLIA